MRDPASSSCTFPRKSRSGASSSASTSPRRTGSSQRATSRSAALGRLHDGLRGHDPRTPREARAVVSSFRPTTSGSRGWSWPPPSLTRCPRTEPRIPESERRAARRAERRAGEAGSRRLRCAAVWYDRHGPPHDVVQRGEMPTVRCRPRRLAGSTCGRVSVHAQLDEQLRPLADREELLLHMAEPDDARREQAHRRHHHAAGARRTTPPGAARVTTSSRGCATTVVAAERAPG